MADPLAEQFQDMTLLRPVSTKGRNPHHATYTNDSDEADQYFSDDGAYRPASGGRHQLATAARHVRFASAADQHGGPSEAKKGTPYGYGYERVRAAGGGLDARHMAISDPSRTDGFFPRDSASYARLKGQQFRLILILPDDGQGLSVEIVYASLGSPPEYTALSYAWGDAKDTRTIRIDGERRVVTASLYGALKMLRRSDREVLLWADALCINQQDGDERTDQVQQMANIYRQARTVAIWLGPSSSDSRQALDLLQAVAQRVREEDEEGVQQLIESQGLRRSFTALVALFEREYWKRLWVVQEVLNATAITVYCGHAAMPWRVYTMAMAAFRRHYACVDRNFAAWLGDDQDFYVSKDRFSYAQALIHLGPGSFEDMRDLDGTGADMLLQALCICRPKLASDPRDKVFGLLGVMPAEVRSKFLPDYSLSVREVYTSVAEHIIGHTGRLDVLSNALYFPIHVTAHGLPTWVPDWSHIVQMTALGARAPHFRAAAATTADVVFDDRRHAVLDVRAVPVDTVYQRGISVSTLNTLDDFIVSFLHWYAILLTRLRAASEDHRRGIELAFCRMLALDNVDPRWGRGADWRRLTFHLFASLAAEGLPDLPLHPRLLAYAAPGTVEGLAPEARNGMMQELFGTSMMGRCFFLTKTGRLGLGTGFVASGDQVVVPLGCSTPLVLRSEGTDGEYRLVGDAYIDGYMYGRAVDEWKAGQRPVRRFRIH